MKLSPSSVLPQHATLVRMAGVSHAKQGTLHLCSQFSVSHVVILPETCLKLNHASENCWPMALYSRVPILTLSSEQMKKIITCFPFITPL